MRGGDVGSMVVDMASGDVKDMTVKVLQKIHAELMGLRSETHALRGIAEETNKRLDDTNKRLDRVQAELVHIRRDAMKRDTALLGV